MTGTTPQDLKARIERYVTGVPAGEERAARESIDALREALATGSVRAALRNADGEWHVRQYSGDPDKARALPRRTLDWVIEAQERGAGEIVLNCMGSDGVRSGYDIEQLAAVRALCRVPLIASGGAGTPEHFLAVFSQADVDGALAANKAFTFDPVTPRAPVNKVTSGLVPGGFIEYNVGFRAWSRADANTQDIVVYYDDIAIGDKPLGQLTPVR